MILMYQDGVQEGLDNGISSFSIVELGEESPAKQVWFDVTHQCRNCIANCIHVESDYILLDCVDSETQVCPSRVDPVYSFAKPIERLFAHQYFSQEYIYRFYLQYAPIYGTSTQLEMLVQAFLSSFQEGVQFVTNTYRDYVEDQRVSHFLEVLDEDAKQATQDYYANGDIFENIASSFEQLHRLLVTIREHCSENHFMPAGIPAREKSNKKVLTQKK